MDLNRRSSSNRTLNRDIRVLQFPHLILFERKQAQKRQVEHPYERDEDNGGVLARSLKQVGYAGRAIIVGEGVGGFHARRQEVVAQGAGKQNH